MEGSVTVLLSTAGSRRPIVANPIDDALQFSNRLLQRMGIVNDEVRCVPLGLQIELTAFALLQFSSVPSPRRLDSLQSHCFIRIDEHDSVAFLFPTGFQKQSCIQQHGIRCLITGTGILDAGVHRIANPGMHDVFQLAASLPRGRLVTEDQRPQNAAIDVPLIIEHGIPEHDPDAVFHVRIPQHIMPQRVRINHCQIATSPSTTGD